MVERLACQVGRELVRTIFVCAPGINCCLKNLSSGRLPDIFHPAYSLPLYTELLLIIWFENEIGLNYVNKK